MKVLVLAPRYLGLGGAERYARQFTGALMHMFGRQSVAVWSFLSGDVEDKVGVKYLGSATRRSSAWGKAKFAGQALRFAGGADLVVATHLAVSPVALWLSRLFGLPYVVIVHGIEAWGVLSAEKQTALRRAERVVATNRFTADRVEHLHRVGSSRIAVVPPVVDPDIMAQADSADGRLLGSVKRVLTVARLAAVENYKGCDTLIRALPGLRDTAETLEYLIVGEGDDRARLEQLARDFGVADIVRFVGRATEHDLISCYASSHLFAMPSRSGYFAGHWRGEGFGIVFIEAGAFGIPAIAGRGDGSAEAVEDGVTGLLVDGEDIGAVAAALRALLVDDGLRRRMGEAARARVVSHFTNRRLERQVEELFASFVPRRGV